MNKSIKDIIDISIVAAIYIVITFITSPIAFGPIQFRVAEILLFLVIYNKKYGISLIIGCAIVNIWSPYVTLDIMVGTIATCLVILSTFILKKPVFLLLTAPIINGIFVSFEIYWLEKLPLLLLFLEVFIGEFLVMLLGFLAFKILEKNEYIMNLIKDIK